MYKIKQVFSSRNQDHGLSYVYSLFNIPYFSPVYIEISPNCKRFRLFAENGKPVFTSSYNSTTIKKLHCRPELNRLITMDLAGYIHINYEVKYRKISIGEAKSDCISIL